MRASPALDALPPDFAVWLECLKLTSALTLTNTNSDSYSWQCYTSAGTNNRTRSDVETSTFPSLLSCGEADPTARPRVGPNGFA